MKLRKLVLALVTLFSVTAMAQEDLGIERYKHNEYYEGYVVDLSGKKTEGYIRFYNRESIQKNVTFYLDKNNKKTKIKYKVKDLKEYKFGDRIYQPVPYAGSINKSIRGLYLMEDGCIQKYMFYDYDKDQSSIKKKDSESIEEYYARLYPPTMLITKRGSEEVRAEEWFLLGFAKKMVDLVGDNAELSDKITNKEKGYKAISGSIGKIVSEYNASCSM